VFVDGLHVLHI